MASSDWKRTDPYDADRLANDLWGISHYFDAETRRFFGCRLVGAVVFTHRPDGDPHTPTVCVVARESVKPPRGGRAHRVVVICGDKNTSYCARTATTPSRGRKDFDATLDQVRAAMHAGDVASVVGYVRVCAEVSNG